MGLKACETNNQRRPQSLRNQQPAKAERRDEPMTVRSLLLLTLKPTMRLFSSILVPGTVALVALAGCVPMRGTMPANTWHPTESEDTPPTCKSESLTDPSSSIWSSSNAVALETALASKDNQAVVSVLGCKIDVLTKCRSTSPLAKDLEGDCSGATHIAKDRGLTAGAGDHAATDATTKRKAGEKIDLTPLSLADYSVTGTWRGVMRQPHGPYEVYNTTLELTHNMDRVAGISRISTVDGQYWGALRFEGRVEGNTIYFADAQVIDDNLGAFLMWCLKGGYLLVDPKSNQLRGPWRAGICQPGTVEVQKVGPNNNVLADIH
jgi:hypothetical protein